jgi:hypothetical protein
VGQPLPLREMLALARMTPEAVAQVRQEWQRLATPAGRALLQAGEGAGSERTT